VHNWPGVSSLRYQLAGRPVRVKRPKKFFAEDGDMPDEVELRFVPPPAWAHLSHAEWSGLLRGRIEAAEAHAADERARSGRRVAGRRAVLRRSPYDCPKTTPPRRKLNPRVAGRDKRKRLAALDRMKRFQARYAEALQRLAEGVRDVLFPHGTWQLARQGLVRCEPAPP
jgi:hypothetical protein